MNLTGVTISGADDCVDPQALVDLSREFPFMECGILISESRVGTPRYPTSHWVCALSRAADDARSGWRASFVGFQGESVPPFEVKLSAHLCGQIARDAMACLPPTFDDIGAFQRIQVNGYLAAVNTTRGLIAAFEDMLQSLILQARSEADLFHAVVEAQHIGGDTSILFDPSGGTGKIIGTFPAAAGCPIGYAGGIGPENVVSVIESIESHVGKFGQPYWIDMESGVRTDDRFDLEKVRLVLERARPFVRGERNGG